MKALYPAHIWAPGTRSDCFGLMVAWSSKQGKAVIGLLSHGTLVYMLFSKS